MNITRRRLAKVLGGGLAALFGGAFLASWPFVGKAKMPFKFNTEQKYRIGAPVYAADLVKPEAIREELGAYAGGYRYLQHNSEWFHRSHPVFVPTVLAAFLPDVMLAMENYERFHWTPDEQRRFKSYGWVPNKRRLNDWFELRWATDEERGGSNGNGVNPRMLLLIGTVDDLPHRS